MSKLKATIYMRSLGQVHYNTPTISYSTESKTSSQTLVKEKRCRYITDNWNVGIDHFF